MPSATVTCSQDNNARVTSGCPGYVSLVYGVDPPPVVTSVAPNAGPLSGNTTVTVGGTNFIGASAVDFGGIPGTGVQVAPSGNSLTVVPPSQMAATVDVTVDTPAGQSATSDADEFTYEGPAVVDAVAPNFGPQAGQPSIVIRGYGFTGATGVSFGPHAATQMTVDSSDEITATAPAGIGTVDVTVDGAGGTSGPSSLDQFTYVPVPTVTGVLPTEGSTDGASQVTVTGTGFSRQTGVFFGSEQSHSVQVLSDSSMTALAPAASAGTVDVTVRTTSGTSPIVAGDTFSYVPPATVTAVAPDVGAAEGDTPVDVTGTGFTGSTSVDFGEVPGSALHIISDSELTVDSPPGSAGVVDVTVNGPGGTSAPSSNDQFTYLPAPSPPVVTNVTPTDGPSAGGTPVVITGSDLSSPLAVFFGSVPATTFSAVSSTEVDATAPAGAGTVDVRVGTPVSLSATSQADHFTYVPPPAVTSIQPDAGPTAGSTTVTIEGSDLDTTSAVTFGSTPASFSVDSDTALTATAPSGTGTVDITVTALGGTSPTSAVDRFTYLPLPTVAHVDPPAGPLGGGTDVAIAGSGFVDVSSVHFGSTATTFTTPTSGLILATAPPGSGTVDVTVTTPGGSSTTSLVDQYTYVPEPSVSSLNVVSGPAAGGGSVTITGTNLSDPTGVAFGATPASYAVESSSEITATVPPGTGIVDVTVTTAGGTSSASSLDQYSYFPTPVVSGIAPNTGTAAGGSQVTITGSGFTGLTWVSFDGGIATNVTELNPETLTATVPPGDGNVDVSVFTSGGFSAPNGAADYTYIPVPQVADVAPNTGATTGGTDVGIIGSGFSGATSVAFGNTPAQSFSVSSDDLINAVAPAGAGAVDITVGSAGGVSPTIRTDQFTYVQMSGYWEVGTDGGIYALGGAPFYGSMGGHTLNAPVVGMAATPDSGGYWEAASDGGIFAFGDAAYFGSMGGQHLNAPVVGLAATPDGHGYWEVGSDGGVYAFGDAHFYGSMGGQALHAPMVGIASTPDGKGYWEAASDGGIFAFGDAQFAGSMAGVRLNKPVVGIATDHVHTGYWEVAADGGAFAFGGAPFVGSEGGQPVSSSAVAMATTPDDGGYWEVASDGAIYAFGDAAYEGSMVGHALNAPIIGFSSASH